eukprot:ANDGO_01071.mRNA.1 hypothetical protein
MLMLLLLWLLLWRILVEFKESGLDAEPQFVFWIILVCSAIARLCNSSFSTIWSNAAVDVLGFGEDTEAAVAVAGFDTSDDDLLIIAPNVEVSGFDGCVLDLVVLGPTGDATAFLEVENVVTA